MVFYEACNMSKKEENKLIAIDKTIKFIDEMEINDDSDKLLVKERCLKAIDEHFEKYDEFSAGYEIGIAIEIIVELEIKEKNGKLMFKPCPVVYDDEPEKFKLFMARKKFFILRKRDYNLSDPLNGAVSFFQRMKVNKNE